MAITQPDPFAVAFTGNIGLPRANDDWTTLHRRGGVDVGASALRLTLVNQSIQTIDISDIRLKTVGSSSAPRGSIASLYTQGDELLKRFAFRLSSAKPNSTVQMYDVVNDIAGYRRDPPMPPHFAKDDLKLKPGEFYDASLTVESEIPVVIAYRLVVYFSSARRDYVVSYPTTFRLSGFTGSRGGSYKHQYLLGHPPGICGADPDNPWVEFKPSAPFCPGP